MEHPETDTSPFGPHWGEKKQTVSTPVPLMTRIALSHNSEIFASVDNLIACAQVDGNGSMSYAPSG